MMDNTHSHEEREEEDDEEYEEVGGGNRLLGFMFGNVDNSGDLDVDYLDEDAKEHLSALADKLGPSLTDMDLMKSSRATTNASEQYYDEKAEDAVDYEDIDEQYDGPEIQAATENDDLLPSREYFSSDALFSYLNHKTSIFDEDDYDEDEEAGTEIKIKEHSDEIENLSLAGRDLEVASVKRIPLEDDVRSCGSLESEEVALEPAKFQEEDQLVPDAQLNPKSESCLPILCIEDGMEILKFSEIFGIHEPLKKADRKYCQKHPSWNGWEKRLDIANVVEEDEEAYLRSTDHDLSITRKLSLAVLDPEEENDQETSYVGDQNKDVCLCSLPMKDDTQMDASTFQCSLLSPKFYPLDQQNWEEGIIWGNSPQLSYGVSDNVSYSENDIDAQSDENLDYGCWRSTFKSNKKGDDLLSHADVVDPIGSVKNAISTYQQFSKEFHHQLIGSVSFSRRHSSHPEEMKTENLPVEHAERNTLRSVDKLSLKNEELLNGSWVDHIIWDSHEAISKPKLIFDLQDEQMLFEILDHEDSKYLSSCAGAMVEVRPSKYYLGEASDVHNQGMSCSARFNISNDKYYSSRKISQQAKSHSKKRTSHGIKVLHSVPALRLQTMKPKLSNKDIANFHRPKALWYPHNNEFAAKARGTLCTNGQFRIVLMTLGGRGIKLHVDAEETLSSVKLKASKKLEFKVSEKVKVFYSGRELEDDKSLTIQEIRPNSVLHLVRTKIQLWPKAQRLPAENKPLRPPGAFKKKSDLSVKDGHIFLMEYCEERPLLLGNVGMGARLCTYYQKLTANDQTASSLRNGNNGLGTVLTLDPTDRSPFLGDIGPGCSQSCLETNMYRSPIFPHKLPPTDYLLVRSAKGALSLRRIDKLYSAGQQEPHMEVLSPGSKNVQSYLVNRMLVYVYREFRANEKPGLIPFVRADELAAVFPGLTDTFMRKRLKLCAELKILKKGAWVKRIDFRIPSEEELRRFLAPEDVVSYESMQAGLYRLKCLGISRLTHPVGLLSAMNQLPDEAITLAAASHIERELQITSWNLTSNFVACTSQDRENIERLEITGVGDPSGRGLAFSFVRVTPKAPITSAVVKKKVTASKGGSTVTGTDADLRRLSMDAAREVLLKFKVPEEQIDKLTRWHRIALVRKLSSEQAASGVKVEAMTLSKFARGQRMSFLQLQQQTREKCQEIWDRQVQSLSAANGDENDSDSEANSDLDSFAGDLENLLDAEEFEEETGNTDAMVEKTDVARGLKMRRSHSFTQTEEEIEDDEAEAAFIRRLLDDDEPEIDKKKKFIGIEVGRLGYEPAGPAKKMGTAFRQILSSSHPGGSYTLTEHMIESKEVENSTTETNIFWKSKAKKGNVKDEEMVTGFGKKKYKPAKDATKEKKHVDRREHFVCGACGQIGHMRTNKNCPKYGEDAEPSEIECASVRSHLSDGVNRQQLKVLHKKTNSTLSKEVAERAPESLEKERMEMEVKVQSLKFKCGSADKPSEAILPPYPAFDKTVLRSTILEAKQSGKNLLIPTKMMPDNVLTDTPKPTVRILPPQGMDKPPKKIVIKQPKISMSTHFRDDVAGDRENRKIRKIVDLTSLSSEKQTKLVSSLFSDEMNVNHVYEQRLRKEEKIISAERFEEERIRKTIEERNYEAAAMRMEEFQYAAKKRTKKSKNKKPDFTDNYLMDHRPYRTDRRLPERDRAAKRRNVVDSGLQEYAQLTKRRRGGEVELANILESIVVLLRDSHEISYMFLKPVTKKDAPDYFVVVDKPMDLSTIREKVRKIEYKNREDFRHDVWQIAYNAHKYNDSRNPGIPPLADQLLELCDHLLEEKDYVLTDAEARVDPANF